MKKAILTLTFLSFLSLAYAQVQELTDFNRQRLEKQRISMLILGSWAVGNIALGAALATQRDGEDKYFHAMNAGWNVVNLGLATAGYLSAVKTGPAGFDLYATINEQYKLQKIFLFNAGLDVFYLATGVLLFVLADQLIHRWVCKRQR